MAKEAKMVREGRRDEMDASLITVKPRALPKRAFTHNGGRGEAGRGETHHASTCPDRRLRGLPRSGIVLWRVRVIFEMQLHWSSRRRGRPPPVCRDRPGAATTGRRTCYRLRTESPCRPHGGSGLRFKTIQERADARERDLIDSRSVVLRRPVGIILCALVGTSLATGSHEGRSGTAHRELRWPVEQGRTARAGSS